MCAQAIIKHNIFKVIEPKIIFVKDARKNLKIILTKLILTLTGYNDTVYYNTYAEMSGKKAC